ncbi:amidase family protein, partial [Streptomyces sp. NPDC055078]
AGRRIALCVNLGDYPVEPEVAAATRAAADALRRAGATVEEITLPWTRGKIMAAAWAHYGSIFAPIIAGEVRAAGGDLADIQRYTRDFHERAANAFTESGRFEALLTEAEVHADLARIFEWADALICPTSGLPAFPAGEDYLETALVVDGVRLDHNLEAPLTVPFNLASRCPVLSVPSGRAANGVPIGLQVVARPYDDPAVFTVGAAVTAAGSWYENEDWRPTL